MKAYRWCSGCQEGHPLDGDVCVAWLDALAAREALHRRRRAAWQRARNRAGRWRRCLVCSQRFDAGTPRRGRPQELCSAACQELREADNQRARRAGSPVQRRHNRTGLRTRGVVRASEEVLAFLEAFPDGWSYVTDLKA